MITLLLSALLSLSAQGPSAAPAPQKPAAQAPALSQADAELVALAKEYNAARAAYDKRLDELRKAGEQHPETTLAHPAREYWPQVEALARRESAAARLWLALQFPNSGHGLAAEARDARWRELLLAAVEANANSAFARELARAVTGLYLEAPPALADEAVEAFVARTTQRELAADALYRAAIAKQRGSKDPASGKSAAFRKRIESDFKDTVAARILRGEAAGGEVGLAVGKLAPDFTTKDADGVEFKLSDYRGKVVVLDFWGFW